MADEESQTHEAKRRLTRQDKIDIICVSLSFVSATIATGLIFADYCMAAQAVMLVGFWPMFLVRGINRLRS